MTVTSAVAVVATALLQLTANAGCDPCGPPAEPLIAVRVELGVNVTPSANHYLHLQMLNPMGEVLDQYDRPLSSIESFPFEHSLGNCDGEQQSSGVFTIRAWLSEQSYEAVESAPDDPQGVSAVDVACTSDGCHAVGKVVVTIDVLR